MTAPSFIANAQRVVEHFGRWPSFHDANVVSYEAASPLVMRVSFTLHAWTMTREVDSKGFFVLTDHALVTFRFLGLRDLEMDDFAAGNILSGLRFSPLPDPTAFRVELDSVMDMSGSFTATTGEIVSVLSCSADGKTA